jgi:hypothetical protein
MARLQLAVCSKLPVAAARRSAVLLPPRKFLSSSSSSSSSSSATDQEPYKSELQDLFDLMEKNGPTTLGSVDDDDLLQPEKILKCGVPESALRFTTTSYDRILMAPHVHPNEHRVVMRVSAEKLHLSPLERGILKEIVGLRLNEEKEELRLTSKQFGSRIENKRHLVSMLDRIVSSSRRLAEEVEKENNAGSSPIENVEAGEVVG